MKKKMRLKRQKNRMLVETKANKKTKICREKKKC